jgi:hypothetical protein
MSAAPSPKAHAYAQAKPEPHENSTEKSYTIYDLLCELRANSVRIVIGAVIGLGLAFAFLSVSVSYYRAEIIIAPAAPLTGAESSSMLANEDLFALRFLVQRLGAGTGSDFQRFENIFSGVSVAAILLGDPKIQDGLARDKSFVFEDHTAKDWSAEKLSDYLKRRVILEPVGLTNAKRMVYLHSDQDFAKYLLGALHHIADSLIRRTIREESRARVEYLSNAMAQTNNPEHRRALTTLLMEQERLLMLVSIDQPYAASVIEPPSVNLKPRWPDAALVYLVLGFVFGLMGFLTRRPVPANEPISSPV